jgi:squalene-associated FAD-dependent desaturase
MRHIHIIGAGMAGLSAALQLALTGEKITLHEGAPFAGGRCRSFHDREIGCRIDNGNHLMLSGNAAIIDYLTLTNALDTMGGPGEPIFPFVDLQSGERWTVRPNKGRVPWWLFDEKRRVGGTRAADYLSILKIMTASKTDRVTTRLDMTKAIYRRFWEPLTVGILNTEPEIASARLLSNVLKQSFAAGGNACIPLIPKTGLSETFVLPCLNVLREHGVEIKFNHRLRGFAMDKLHHVRELDFSSEIIKLTRKDWVVLALPAWVTRDLLPEISVPTEFRSIVNAHYRFDGLKDPVGFTGVVGGLAEWVFVRNGVASVTVSCSERYGNYPVRDMAYYIWGDVAKLYGFDPEIVPPHRIFKEKFATFAATPEQNARRPSAYIGWRNLALAGEWTATGLPSTIEGAVRSGVKAAQVVLRWS